MLPLSRVRWPSARPCMFYAGPHLYVVKLGPHVKIGWSLSFWGRFRGLRREWGKRLRVISVRPIPATSSPQWYESGVHYRFAHHHFEGEWFWAHSEILRWTQQPLPPHPIHDEGPVAFPRAWKLPSVADTR